jgi:hypothetical protein
MGEKDSKTFGGDNMKIITIKAPKEHQFDSRYNSNSKEDHKNWVSESHKKIGYIGNNYLFCGNPKIKWEFVWIKDRLFHRYDGKGHFSVCDYYKNIYPDIICQCGGSGFYLLYGGYELFAKCSKCGREDSVYSG